MMRAQVTPAMALGAFTVLLAVAFLLLLVADQTRRAVGVF